jgi:hypothetical protein
MNTEPITINGKTYPLWSKFVTRKADWIGGVLEDLDPDALPDNKTIITDITLTPNGTDSAKFEIEGPAWGCGADVKFLGIIGAMATDNSITFEGYGGHRWKMTKPNQSEMSLSA